jgi:hypothetical protein
MIATSKVAAATFFHVELLPDMRLNMAYLLQHVFLSLEGLVSTIDMGSLAHCLRFVMGENPYLLLQSRLAAMSVPNNKRRIIVG